MSARRRSVLAVACALAAAGAAGCGGGEEEERRVDRSDTSPSAQAAAPTPATDPELALPKGVPQRATGRVRPASARVIRRWLAALGRGDVERAAHFFALPSKFQNTGTPVLHIDSEIERIAINMSLTCGARAERMGGAGAYTIVRFRLIDRPGPGGGCGSGTGATARGAILVAAGKIREWYRLPDEPSAPAPSAPPGPSA
jgi:hypothetical protein